MGTLLLISLTASSQGGADKKAIEAQIGAFLHSWSKHDFSDMKNYVAEDCDFVNKVGMLWKGHADIQYAHQAYHDQFFKSTPLEKRSIAIRFIRPDVAIVHFKSHIGAFTPPDGSKRGDNDDLSTMVFVKQQGVWMIEAVENVEVSEPKRPFDPFILRNQQGIPKK